MKIEIDLDDIFRDEDGAPEESLEDSIRRQVIDKLSGDLRKRLFSRLDEKLSEVLDNQLSAAVAERIPSLIDDLMNAEYTPVGRYGDRGEKTTFRAQLLKTISEQCVYKPGIHRSDENAFTQTIRTVVDGQFEAVKKDLVAQIDGQFRANALAFAVKTLSEKLGLKTS